MATDLTGQAARPAAIKPAWLASWDPARARGGAGPALRLLADGDRSSSAEHGPSRSAVLFEGTLYERERLARELGPDCPPGAPDAELVLHAYLRHGDGIATRLRGIYAIAIWDGSAQRLLCLRDHLGAYPLYYAQAGGELLISTSTDLLLEDARVPRSVDVPSLASFVTYLWGSVEDTCYTAIRRLPPGHLMRLAEGGSPMVRRYWDPVPHSNAEALSDEEAERFEELLEMAVERCVAGRRSGVFLSGGIDSCSVAMAAADITRERGLGAPWALSLSFPDDLCNEDDVQFGVARGLGLSQVMLGVDEAVEPKSLIEAGLEVAAESAAPLINPWAGAYERLASEGRARGVEVILGGAGGDDLLAVNTVTAADEVASLKLRRLLATIRYHRQSYGASTAQILRVIVWRNGLRPVLSGSVGGVVQRHAPELLAARRRRAMMHTPVDWAVPGRALRRELVDRAIGRRLPPMRTGRAREEARAAFDQPLVAMEMEEYFDMGRRAGVAMLHPYWDPDIAHFLFRMPHRLLLKGGWAKWPARRLLAERFPDLGFANQQKVRMGDFAGKLFLQQGAPLWERMGGVAALAEAGIVDKEKLDLTIRQIVMENDIGKSQLFWDLLSLEAWLRPRL
jgi:asparagine synthetase B (glutamine-hydrolysing)